MKIKLYQLVLLLFYPILSVTEKLYASFGKKLIDGKKYEVITTLIRPGDFLLSYTRGEFSNLYNPSNGFAHGALYCGSGKIVEAVGKGVIEDRLSNFCYKKDYIAIVRPPVTGARIGRMIAWAESKVGLPYDYQFEVDEEYYCFELLGAALEQVSPIIIVKDKLLDGHFYTADSFLTPQFNIIYNTRES